MLTEREISPLVRLINHVAASAKRRPWRPAADTNSGSSCGLQATIRVVLAGRGGFGRRDAVGGEGRPAHSVAPCIHGSAHLVVIGRKPHRRGELCVCPAGQGSRHGRRSGCGSAAQRLATQCANCGTLRPPELIIDPTPSHPTGGSQSTEIDCTYL